MSVSLEYLLKATANELTQIGGELVGSVSLRHEQILQGLLTSTSTPQVQTVWSDERTLAAGASELLDLTALTKEGLTTAANFSGRNLELVMFYNTGPDPIIVEPDPSATGAQPYPLFVDAAGKVRLEQGMAIYQIGNDKLPTVVDGSADRIQVSTTGAQGATYRVLLVG